MITIEYWSDFVCPFCYIGFARLKKAVAALSLEDQVEFAMRSFELDRYAPVTVSDTATEHFARKYRQPLEKAQVQVEKISQMGRAEGLVDMDYANTRSTNTLDAHRLAKYAKQEEDRDIQELLYHAFFCEHLNIGEKSILLSLAERAGLSAKKAAKVLSSNAYEEEVRRNERQAKLLDIHKIPHFVFAGKKRLSGAGSAEEMTEALKDVME